MKKKSVQKICVLAGFLFFLFAKEISGNSWQVEFLARANGVLDSGPDTPTFGVKEGALDSLDRFDLPAPVCGPGPCLNLYFSHPDEPFFKQFKRDIRPPIACGGTKTWDFHVQVANFLPANVTISWPNLSLVPEEYSLTLIDITGGNKEYDMRKTSSFSYTPTSSVDLRQFQVVVNMISPVANAGDDVSIYPGRCTTIGGLPAATGGAPPYTYLWTPSIGLSSDTASNPLACPDTTTIYTLTVIDSKGCTDTDQVIVTVNLPPIAKGNLLINEVAFKEINDWIEFYVISGGDLSGIRIYKGGTKVKEFPHITARAGDYLVLHFNSSAPDEDDTTGRGPNGYWDIYTTNPGLTGTDDVIRIQRQGTEDVSPTNTLDAVIWSNNNGSFTGNKTIANNLVAAGHWDRGYDFMVSDSGAWIDSDDISFGQSIGRDRHSTDSNSRDDWERFTSSTMGENNVFFVVNAGADDAVCFGSCTKLSGSATGGTPPYTYSWSPSIWLNNPNIATPTACPDTTTIYTLTVIDSKGCTNTDQVIITINPTPVATASSNSPVLEGSSIQLTGGPSGMDSYSWVGPDGWTSPLQNPIRPNATQAMSGVYTLTVIDSKGCTDEIQIEVTVSSKLVVATASSNSPVCEGSIIRLFGGPDGMKSYAWIGPDGWTSSLQNPTRDNVTIAMAGTYTLTITMDNGYTDKAKTIVTVNTSTVQADFVVMPIAPLTVSFIDSSTGSVISYLWEFGDGKTSNLQNPRHTYKAPGKYTVSLTVSDTCGSNTKSLSITVATPPKAVIIEPKDQDRISGDVLWLKAIGLNDGEIEKVIFQYRPKGHDWIDIGQAFPPELEAVLNIPGEGDYQLRAIAYDRFGFKDPSPRPITITFTQIDCHYVERLIRKHEDNTILACDGSLVTILKESLEKDTDIIKIENLPCFLEAGEDLVPANSYLELSLLLGKQKKFDKEITIKMKYEDKDNNGLIGDLKALEETLSIYYCGGNGWERLKTIEHDLGRNTITAYSTKDTLLPARFGLFGKAASDFSNLIIYPNPCRLDKGDSKIIFANLPSGSSIRIYNIAGELVTFKEESSNSFSWNVEDNSPGVYLYVIEKDGRIARGKVAVIR